MSNNYGNYSIYFINKGFNYKDIFKKLIHSYRKDANAKLWTWVRQSEIIHVKFFQSL